MDEQLQKAVVSHDVEFIKKHLNPSEGLQPPVIDYRVLSDQLLEFKWLSIDVVDLGKIDLTRLFLTAYNQSITIVDGGLHRAVRNLDVNHVRYFLQEFNVNPNRYLRSNLETLNLHFVKCEGITDPQLISNNDKAMKIMKMLIARGAKMVTPRNGYNDLQVKNILESGTTEVVSIILDTGEIDPEERYNDECTVAHFLAQNPNPNTLTLLQNRDFRANLRDKSGRTPLLIASEHGVAQSVEFLLKKGADVNIASRNFTPLGIATYKHFKPWNTKPDYMESILLLLEYGADVQAQYLGQHLDITTDTVFDVLREPRVDQRPSEAIIQHLALQAAIGTIITERVQNTINSYPGLKEILNNSRQLLQRKIYESHTLFSMLTWGERKLISLMRREHQLAEKLQSYLQSNSSIYYNHLLQKRLAKAGQIIELRGKAAFVVGKLMEMDYNRQPVVVDIVLSYLDLEDFNALLSL